MSIETNRSQLDIALSGGPETAMRCAKLMLDNANTRIGDTILYSVLLAVNGTPVPPHELEEVMEGLKSKMLDAGMQYASLQPQADPFELIAEA